MRIISRARQNQEFLAHESIMVALTECVCDIIGDDANMAELVDGQGGLLGTIAIMREHSEYRKHAWVCLGLINRYKDLGCVSFNLHATGIPSLVVFLSNQLETLSKHEKLCIACCEVGSGMPCGRDALLLPAARCRMDALPLAHHSLARSFVSLLA